MDDGFLQADGCQTLGCRDTSSANSALGRHPLAAAPHGVFPPQQASKLNTRVRFPSPAPAFGQAEQLNADAATCGGVRKTVARAAARIAASIPEDAADSPASS